MRYESLDDLPDTIRDVLPEEAQELYLEAYQKAWDAYKPEIGGDLGQAGMAHRDAWHVVKKEYVQDEKKGDWYRKGEEPEDLDEEDEDEGFFEGISDTL
ncbi:MAG: ChaB family protein [Anaerolineales bacterium]